MLATIVREVLAFIKQFFSTITMVLDLKMLVELLSDKTSRLVQLLLVDTHAVIVFLLIKHPKIK